MGFTLQEIADALGADAFGAAELTVTGAAEPAQAGPDDLALAMDPEYADGLAKGAARAALLWEGADWQALGLRGAIVVKRARYAMSGLTQLLDKGPDIAPGIHPTAVVDPTAEIGDDAAIGPFVVIGKGVRLGRNVRIDAHASLGAQARIGDDALIHVGCRIGARVVIGVRLFAQPGAVVGADGFSFVTPEKSRVEERIRVGRASIRWARSRSVMMSNLGRIARLTGAPYGRPGSGIARSWITWCILPITLSLGTTFCCVGRWGLPDQPPSEAALFWAVRWALATIFSWAMMSLRVARPRSCPMCRRAGLCWDIRR
jgi:acetyltransferase-like isoleucine patch superfamily enzyme